MLAAIETCTWRIFWLALQDVAQLLPGSLHVILLAGLDDLCPKAGRDAQPGVCVELVYPAYLAYFQAFSGGHASDRTMAG